MVNSRYRSVFTNPRPPVATCVYREGGFTGDKHGIIALRRSISDRVMMTIHSVLNFNGDPITVCIPSRYWMMHQDKHHWLAGKHQEETTLSGVAHLSVGQVGPPRGAPGGRGVRFPVYSLVSHFPPNSRRVSALHCDNANCHHTSMPQGYKVESPPLLGGVASHHLNRQIIGNKSEYFAPLGEREREREREREGIVFISCLFLWRNSLYPGQRWPVHWS